MFDSNKRFLENTHWSIFVISAGLFWALYLIFVKAIGLSVTTLSSIIFVLLTMSLVQMIIGVVFTIRSGFLLFPGRRPVLGSMLLGVFNTYLILAILYLVVFYNIHIISIAFFVALTMFPSVAYEQIVFGRKSRIFYVLPVALLMFGIYTMAGFSSLLNLSSVPTWFWIGLTIPIVSIIGDLLSRKIGSAAVFSQWVHHIWSGLTTMFIALGGILVVLVSGFSISFSIPSLLLWFSLFSSIAIISFVFTRQRSYMAGGDISKKKIYILTVFFLSMFLSSPVFFGEIFTSGEIRGVLSILVASLLLL